ncbi:MAG: GEVED domain-containing protein [Sphingomonadaceae bacterium]
MSLICRLVMALTKAFLIASALATSSAAFAQASVCLNRQISTFSFVAPTLESGTALSVGAVYRFSNVAPGVDARVRVDAMSVAGALAFIDRDTGLVNNFQPELGGANARSVDFTIFFVAAGTNNPLTIDLAATAIDIDGDGVSIREYAEFSNAYAVYALNNPSLLDLNASGPSIPTNSRFEARTAANAPGIDPTAAQNLIQFLYTGASSFRYRIGALGTGATVRLTSLDFSCPAIPSPVPTTATPQDFSDAPASYGNPIHDIVAGVRLGASVTAETVRYANANAAGDSGDDGVTISSPLFQGQNGTATATVFGAGGFLQAWIDWNGNGTFADAGEQVATNVRDNQTGDTNPAVGIITVAFAVPPLATTTQTFARFRWSLQSGGDSATTVAPSGEVEDYALIIMGRAVVQLSKTSTAYLTTGPNQFHIPGSDVIYTLSATNVGAGNATLDSIFVTDSLPTTIEFYNGDIDDAGPATGSIIFSTTGSGLSFTPATDLRFSNAVAAPVNFAACNYPAASGYDPAIRHVCFNPKGTLLAGTPSPTFSFQLRARIR